MFECDTAYDAFMGRYSRRLAPLFADFAGVGDGDSVADVGAGTGVLAIELASRGLHVTAADPSPQFVEAMRARLPGCDVQVAPAEDLPWPDESFDAALAQLVVSFMSDARAGVLEMRRVVKPGGTVAVCMWDKQGMEMLAAVNRARSALGGADGLPDARYRTREEIEPLFGDGFADLHTELIEVDASYSGYDEFWTTLLGGAGPVGAWVASLDDDGREKARSEISRQIGEPDGPFTLRGKAWATRAIRA
jgi:ubiquinone/menaquinone biosynthesis C-methylase UbiE